MASVLRSTPKLHTSKYRCLIWNSNQLTPANLKDQSNEILFILLSQYNLAMQIMFDSNALYCWYESTIVCRSSLLISRCQSRIHWQSNTKDPQSRVDTNEACEGEILDVINTKVMLPLWYRIYHHLHIWV